MIVTEWDAFHAHDLARLKRTMTAPVPVDPRNVYNRQAVEAAGFRYDSVGH